MTVRDLVRTTSVDERIGWFAYFALVDEEDRKRKPGGVQSRGVAARDEALAQMTARAQRRRMRSG